MVETCESPSAIWITLTPIVSARLAHPLRVAGIASRNPVLGCDIVSARLGGDDRDPVGGDFEMPQQQRQDPLAYAAETDDDETAWECDVLLVEHGGRG